MHTTPAPSCTTGTTMAYAHTHILSHKHTHTHTHRIHILSHGARAHTARAHTHSTHTSYTHTARADTHRIHAHTHTVHTHTHTHTSYTHTHTHARTHARAPSRTHTHTQTLPLDSAVRSRVCHSSCWNWRPANVFSQHSWRQPHDGKPSTEALVDILAGRREGCRKARLGGSAYDAIRRGRTPWVSQSFLLLS